MDYSLIFDIILYVSFVIAIVTYLIYEKQKLFLDTPLNQLSLFDIFNPDDGDVHNNLRIGPINNNDYYKDAIFQLIDRNLIKDRLDAIVNEPLMSPNNVALISIHDIESMLQ